MKISLKLKGKKIPLEVKKCGLFGKFRGLMFRQQESAPALMFELSTPCRISIHSIFVFFDFIAIWINSEGKIIDVQLISPWKFSVKPKRDFVRLIEIPVNSKYSKVVNFLDGKLEKFKN